MAGDLLHQEVYRATHDAEIVAHAVSGVLQYVTIAAGAKFRD
jgi:hypothetical protein